MKIFIDTANIDEIKEILSFGLVDGVTTNPSLVAKENKELRGVIEDICAIVDGPVSAEVISSNAEEIVKEGRGLSKIHKNIVVKIPMSEEGVKAISILSKEGIKTNMTLIFSVQQAIIAAKAGANYVSPFIGRLDDIGHNGIKVIEDITTVFRTYNIDTEIIAASIRSSMHVLECAMVGAQICTIPYEVIKQMFKHPLTDNGIKKFLHDHNNIVVSK